MKRGALLFCEAERHGPLVWYPSPTLLGVGVFFPEPTFFLRVLGLVLTVSTLEGVTFQ